VIRLPEDTNIADDAGEWTEVRHLRKRAGKLRIFTNVRLWEGGSRRATRHAAGNALRKLRAAARRGR
jgi:hypothetical protein